MNQTDLLILFGHFIFLIYHHTHSDNTNQILTYVALMGIFRGMLTLFKQFTSTRFLTYMVEKTIGEMIPLLFFLIGQIIIFSAVFTLTRKHKEPELFLNDQEDPLTLRMVDNPANITHPSNANITTGTISSFELVEDYDADYISRGDFWRSFLKTLDFAVTKDDYKFRSWTGQSIQVIGIVYLNIIILNFVIALVSDVYSNIQNVKKETEIKLKAEMLKELYDIYDFWTCFCKKSTVTGNLFVLRYCEQYNLIGSNQEEEDEQKWEGIVNSIKKHNSQLKIEMKNDIDQLKQTIYKKFNGQNEQTVESVFLQVPHAFSLLFFD